MKPIHNSITFIQEPDLGVNTKSKIQNETNSQLYEEIKNKLIRCEY